MYRVTIKADDYSVEAVVHDGPGDDPFAGLNQDALLADALVTALLHARPGIWNPAYVLARCVVEAADNELMDGPHESNAIRSLVRAANELVVRIKQRAAGPDDEAADEAAG